MPHAHQDTLRVHAAALLIMQAAQAQLWAATPPRDGTPKAEYVAATALTCLAAGLGASAASLDLASYFDTSLAGSNMQRPDGMHAQQATAAGEARPDRAGEVSEAESRPALAHLPQQLLELASSGMPRDAKPSRM